MNIFLPASLPIMKWRKILFAKRPGWRLITTVNGIVLYVQTPKESLDKIPLAAQRHLINNFKNATELGAEVLQVKDDNVAKAIMEMVEEKQITTVCIGKPHLNLFQVILRTNVFQPIIKNTYLKMMLT